MLIEEIKRDAKQLRLEPARIIEIKSETLGIPYRDIYSWYRSQNTQKRRASHPVMEAQLAKYIQGSARRLRTKEIAAKAKEILDSCAF